MKRLLLTIPLALILIDCDKSELESAKHENERLRSRIEHLAVEVRKLQETADYHFRQGKDQIAAKQWNDAITSLRNVIDKYPNAPLVDPAREALLIAERERDAENQRKVVAEAAASRAREKEIKGSGEPVSYGTFYAKYKTGLQIGKRYRFVACLHQGSYIDSSEPGRSQLIVNVYMQFDDVSEYEQWLTSGREHCGTIVAAMLWGGRIAISRLH